MIEIAKKNGINGPAYRSRLNRGWSKERAATEPLGRRGGAITREYAVYRGDDLVIMGTAKECAEHLGVQTNYIYWLTTPAAMKRQEKQMNKNGLRVVKFERDDDEWI